MENKDGGNSGEERNTSRSTVTPTNDQEQRNEEELILVVNEESQHGNDGFNQPTEDPVSSLPYINWRTIDTLGLQQQQPLPGVSNANTYQAEGHKLIKTSPPKKTKHTSTFESATQTNLGGEVQSVLDPIEGTSRGARTEDDAALELRDDRKMSRKKDAARRKWVIRMMTVLQSGAHKIGQYIDESDEDMLVAFERIRGNLGIAFGKNDLRYLLVGVQNPRNVIVESTDGVGTIDLPLEQSDDPMEAGCFFNNEDERLQYYYVRVNPPTPKKFIALKCGGGTSICFNCRAINTL